MCFTRLEEWKRIEEMQEKIDSKRYIRYQSIEIGKEKKSFDFDDIDDFPIEIDNDFLSVTIDSHRLLSILLIDNNRLIIFSVTSISIDFRYQSILIGGLNRLISMISIDFRCRFLSDWLRQEAADTRAARRASFLSFLVPPFLFAATLDFSPARPVDKLGTS